MSMVEINAKHDPKTAVFWARFATAVGEQQRHCPTVTLYENSEGEFFVVEESPKVAPTRTELVIDPRKWLQKRVDWLNAQMRST